LPVKNPAPPNTNSNTMPMILSLSRLAFSQGISRPIKVIRAIINQPPHEKSRRKKLEQVFKQIFQNRLGMIAFADLLVMIEHLVSFPIGQQSDGLVDCLL